MTMALALEHSMEDVGYHQLCLLMLLSKSETHT